MKARLRILILGIVVLAPIPVPAAEVSAKAAGWNLVLTSDETRCSLGFSKPDKTGKIVLQPDPPCYFAGEEAPQVEKLKGTEVVLIVFGTPYKGRPVMKADRRLYCGTVSQGIIVTEECVRVSPRIAEGGLRCEGINVDRREFEMFSALPTTTCPK